MKKILLLSIVFIVLSLALTACAYRGYSGENVELYTVATNSVLWLNGHSWGADFVRDSEIEILDVDAYGRTLFTYHEQHYSGADMAFSALIICQASNENEVFFYEDVNYIVKEQAEHTPTLEKFSQDEIDNLKILNDWGQAINLDKCVKKATTRNKPDIPCEEETTNRIKEEFDLVGRRHALFMHYLTSDSSGANYIIYGYIFRSETDGIFFVGLIENNDIQNMHFLCPENVYNYKAELIEFKEQHNWQ